MVNTDSILESNLTQLRRTDLELVERLAQLKPAPLQWSASRSGPLTASVQHAGRPIALASRYDPPAEALKLIEKVDLKKHAGIAVLGVGLGYHVSALAERIGDRALLIVFEPDIAQLRAVLERIDHSAWLGRHNVILADDQMDRGSLVRRIEPFAGALTQGTILLTHPPSRQLQGERLGVFGQMITDVLAYCRTNVATSLVNASRTIHNLSMNLPYYAAGATSDDLFNITPGYPAVCVGAGPSLVRNVDLLADPRVRPNIVIISAQTTLRPLLERGVRPDFVTALDFSLISTRFYEGLPRLPDVTLVAEPMAHPSVLASFPGPKRVTPSGFLDQMLGDLARPMVPIPPGATVAHLSFYLAQHLGCDPIILIGQDLGFSEGLYYCPGTAIHDVWVPELGAFNTLEMMEWQRIVRHRGNLKQVRDIRDRPIYSDEQMQTYLKQFERDFAKAPQTVLDATEGGVPKLHTTAVTLAEALQRHATRVVPSLPLPPDGFDRERLGRVESRLDERIEEVSELRRLSRATLPVLRKMLANRHDRVQMRRLFDRLTPLRRRVDELKEVFMIINQLNAIGVFKRARADRVIEHAGAELMEEQRLRLERDISNVDWLIQACDEAVLIFRDGLANIKKMRRAAGTTGNVQNRAFGRRRPGCDVQSPRMWPRARAS